jgi:hypothetical protein
MRLPLQRLGEGILLVLTLAGALHAEAQQTANLYGQLRDREGVALPGATVTLKSRTSTQVQLSNAMGEFRFLDLAIEPYALTAELPGFGTVSLAHVVPTFAHSSTLEITMYAVVAVEPPPLLAASTGGDIIALDASWNSWLEDSQGEVENLEEGKDYRVFFDLAGIDYSRLGAVGDVAVSAGSPLLDYLRSLPKTTHSLSLTALPIVVGNGVSIRNQRRRRQTLDVDKLRRTAQLLATLSSHDLRSIANALNALRLEIDLHTDGPGCALVGFALFDLTVNRSLGFVGIQLPPVPGGPSCPAATNSARLNTTLASLITSPGVPKADATLFVMDFDGGRVTNKTVVVYEDDTGSLLTWRPLHSLSDYAYSDSDGGLRKDLALAHCQHSPSTSCLQEDFSSVIANLARVIFYDRTAAGQAAADKAYGLLSALAARATKGNRPSIMCRFVDADGVTRILPFGLIGLPSKHMLGEYVNILQALPTERFVQANRCVRKWYSLLPLTLASVNGVYLQPLVPSVPSMVSSFADFDKFLGTPAPSPNEDVPEGLLILAHYLPEGELKFDPNGGDGLVAEGIKRDFGTGSVAVIAACGTGSLSPTGHDQPLITVLNDHHIDAMIVSPFDINAELGARFVAHLSNRIQSARAGEAASFLDIFQAALSDTRRDPLVKQLYQELSEFVLAGNGAMQVCP